MRADKRIGVILALVGVGLPLALLPFADSYFPEKGFLWSLRIMSVPLWQTKPEKACPPAPTALELEKLRSLYGSYAEPPPCFPIPAEYFAVPYGYFFALGVVVFLGGLGLLILGNIGNKKGGVR